MADVSALPTLSRAFFDRDPRRVARDLLGKLLLRREPGGALAGRIVETEAYLGTNDPAAHAASGPTARNQVIFGPPGHAYVYFVYGNHFCLNVSCLPVGSAGCVLIRALEPVCGLDLMRQNRGLARAGPDALACSTPSTRSTLKLLTSGPGRLAQALAITRSRDNGKCLLQPSSDLLLAEDGFQPTRILRTPRIGITKAADVRLRYVIAGNAFVSGKRLP